MNTLLKLFTTSIGKKYLMAITGIALVMFLFGHLMGNLQIFLGADYINAYATFLKSKTGLLWGARLSMLTIVTIHILMAVQLSLSNAAARPTDYAEAKAYKASYASRTMIWSGLIIFAFIVYHLLHFTVCAIDPGFHELVDDQGRFDCYRMMVIGFSNPLVSSFYIVAIGLLCFHLSHGISAMIQSLGLRVQATRQFVNWVAIAIAVLLFLGYSSIPLAVLAGVVK